MTATDVPRTPQDPAPVAPSAAPKMRPQREEPHTPTKDVAERFDQLRGVQPPADFEERFRRLIKSRVDALSSALVDDRGRVLREPLMPEEALRNTLAYLPRFLASDYGADALRAYMAGGKTPGEFAPRKGIVPSIETQNLDLRAQAGRAEMNPAWLAARDYVIDPLRSIVPAITQVGADVAVGGLNLLPGGTTEKIDVEAYFRGSTREELDAIARARPGGAKVAAGSANLVGQAAGMSMGGVGKVLSVGGKLGAPVGKALFGKAGQLLAGTAGKEAFGALGKAIGHSAGAFGAYEGLVAKSGERLEGIVHGFEAGALMGAAQKVTSLALRWLFAAPVKALGADERGAMDALKKWATENKVFAEKGETTLGYEKRVVDSWIAEGLPGAPPMPGRKLIAAAAKGGADAIGFSMLDQQFRQDLIDAAWHGDASKWQNVLTTFSGNFLGAAALHMPLKEIVPWQRRQSIGAPRDPNLGKGRIIDPFDLTGVTVPDRPATDAEFQVQPTEPLALPAPRESRLERATTARDEALGEQYAERWRLVTEGRSAQEKFVEHLLGSLDNIIPLGWKPSEKSVRDLPEAKDVTVKITGNGAERLRQTGLLNPNSPAAKQIVGMEGGDLTLRPKDARRFLRDWEARRDEVRQSHGDAVVDTIENVAAEIAKAVNTRLPPRLNGFGEPGPKVEGPDYPGPPLGEPYVGDAPLTPEPREGPSDRAVKIELSKSGQSFTIKGDTARPSPAMRDSLGLPAEMPAKELVPIVEKASLRDALHAKANLPGDEISVGMHATPGRGDEPPMVRRVVMGEVQEAPFTPEPDWKPAEVVPSRGKDAIEPEQHQAVNVLRAVAETREDMDPQDRSLLNGAIDVLDTVAAANDQSVAETMAAMPKLVEAIAKGEPGAEKALAESLTTKTPERAMTDAKWSRGKITRTTGEGIDEVNGQTRGIFGVNRGKGGFSVTHLPTGLRVKSFKSQGEAKEFVDAALAEIDKRGLGEKVSSSDRDTSAEALIDVVRDIAGMRRNPYTGKMEPVREPPPGEAGNVDAAILDDITETARQAASEGKAAVSTVGREFFGKFYRSQIDRVEKLGMHDIAELGRDATTATKRFQTRMDVAGLMDLRRLSREQLDSMETLKGDGKGGYADEYARAMDAATARHFGAVDLSPEQRKVVDLGRAVTLEGGRIAEELGVEQTDSKGRNPRPFTADPNRHVLVREYTPEMQQARLKQSGPLWDAMLGWLERTYNWTPEEAAKQFSEARSLTAVDATEIRRSIDVIPTHLDVPGHSQPVRILESNPLKHAERLAFRNSQVMGSLSVMPRNTPKPVEGAKEFANDPRLEPLPLPAQQLVNKVLNERGPDAAEAVAKMVRAMNGMPIAPSSAMFTPGEPGYRFMHALSGLFGVKKAAALTMSFAANIAEPINNAAHFGTAAVANGYKEVFRTLVAGKFAELHKEGVASGFLADTKLNDPLHGDTGLDTVNNVMRKTADILTTPMRMTQDVNELVNYVAARDRLAAMRKGEGIKADANALSLLGFTPAEIGPMLKGEGTPEQYERYQRNIVGNLAGGKSLRSAEKSDLANSRGFNSIVWFTNFFQVRSRVLATLTRDVATASPEARAEKFGQLLQLAAFTTAAGTIGNLVKQYLLGGSDGVSDYVRENTSGGAEDVAKNFLGLFASGIVGGLGQPVRDAFRSLGEPGDTADQWARSALRLVGPVDAGIQFTNYLRALSDQDVPGYENKDALGKTAKYLRDFMPAAKAVHEGLFGSSLLAISDKNIELDNAQDSRNRWLREHRPADFGARGGTEEDRAFRDRMRGVMDRIAAGKEWTDDDLVAAVIDAEAAKQQAATDQGERTHVSAYQRYIDARDSVAESLRSRKMLPRPGAYTNAELESLQAHLGEKNWQTLQNFDTVLDLIAKRVKSANLRTQVNEKR